MANKVSVGSTARHDMPPEPVLISVFLSGFFGFHINRVSSFEQEIRNEEFLLRYTEETSDKWPSNDLTLRNFSENEEIWLLSMIFVK